MVESKSKSKAASKSKSKEEEKPQELSADDLAKAIENSTKAVIGKSDEVASEQTANEDKGESVPVIVKRNKGYVAPPNGAESNVNAQDEPKATAAAADVRPPSATRKTVEPVASEASSNEAEQNAEPPAEPKPDPADVVEPAPAATPAESNAKEESVQEASDQPADKNTTAQKSPEQANSQPDAKPNENVKTVAVSDAANQPQKPTVFDTDQYHLPIRPRSKGGVGNFLAWTILATVFLGVAGYVMHRLGVIDLTQFGF